MNANFKKHFNKGLSVASFPYKIGNEPAAVKTYLDQLFRAEFRSRLAFQTWMFPQETLDYLTGHSFDEGVSDLFNAAAETKRDVREIFSVQAFFTSCKHLYHKQLFMQWRARRDNTQLDKADTDSGQMIAEANIDYHFKSCSLTEFNQMERACRDYFTWQFIDHFTPDQIGTITGKAPDVFMKELWACFQCTERICCSKLELPMQEKCTEEQFRALYAYFNNLLTALQEKDIVQEIRQKKALQYYFQFFLSLHFEWIDGSSVSNVLKEDNNELIRADEFISLVQKQLETQSSRKSL